MSPRSSMAKRLVLIVGVTTFMAIAPGLTGSTWASSAPGHRNHHTVPPRVQSVSGTWAGSYSGTFTGTFKLTWKESNSKLSGKIMISGFSDVPTNINGALQGTSISFGTVGSRAITYTGSVAGNSMSGTWKMGSAGQTVGTGSWKASKSS